MLFSHGVEVATAKPLSKPAKLKNLCRDVVRKTMRNLTDSRTIQPLVASLEKTNFIIEGEKKMPLPEKLGDFLVYDLSGNWRKKMVNDC